MEDLEFNDYPVCPHCGDWMETPWEMQDDQTGDGDEVEYECGTCGRSVVATVHIIERFSTRA